jgi:hypothetical protein
LYLKFVSASEKCLHIISLLLWLTPESVSVAWPGLRGVLIVLWFSGSEFFV